MTHWSFTVSPFWLVVLGLVWLAGAWLCWTHWRRRRGRAVAVMELLRLAALTAVLFTLTQPERVREEEITEAPEIVILHDASGSMQTLDVVHSQTNLQTRAAWLSQCLATNFWTPLEPRAEILVEHFARPASSTNQAGPTDGTDLHGALRQVLETRGQLKAVMVLSDGDWNAGENPLAAAGPLRMKNVPVFAVGIGREERLPDLVLEPASVPSFGLLGEQISIPFRVRSHLSRQVSSTLTLRDAGNLRLSRAVTVPAYGQAQGAFVWQPQAVGTYQFHLSLPVEADEYLDDNNDRTFRVEIRTEKLRVLVMDSRPRWEYRYLRNALERDPGVDVDCLLFHPSGTMGQGTNYLNAFPSSRPELSPYDVVFLGDVGIGEGELAAEDAALLRGLVEEQASGLVLMPGRRGRHVTWLGSALEDLVPVTLDAGRPEGWSMAVESPLLLTASGQEHFLTKLAADDGRNNVVWRNLPGFYWSAAVERARPGAEVLAVHGNLRTGGSRTPLLVTRSFGNGEVLFMGTDGAWRWRRGVEDTYHYRFWGQVVRWMAHKRHMSRGEGFRLSFSPENPRAGQQVYFQATILDLAGWNEGQRVQARIEAPSGRAETLEFEPGTGGWGVHAGSFRPGEDGLHRITLTAERGARRLETTFEVMESKLEKIGHPANLTVLRELAAMTGGAYAAPQDLDSLIRQMELLPEAEPRQIRFRLWANPWWGGLVILLLGTYWTARKASGMF